MPEDEAAWDALSSWLKAWEDGTSKPEAVVQVKHRREERCERWTPASRDLVLSEVAAKGAPECGRRSGRLLDGEVRSLFDII